MKCKYPNHIEKLAGLVRLLLSDKSHRSDISQQEHNNSILSNVSLLKLSDNRCSICLKDLADPTNPLTSRVTSQEIL